MYKFNFLKIFKDTVSKNKSKVGLIDINDKEYSFNQLDILSDKLATLLEKYKKENSIIAIDSKKSLNTIISFLACLKIGIPYFFRHKFTQIQN